MSLKDCIDIYQDLVDNIIIQYNNGYEEEMPSEDAEFLDEETLEMSVSIVQMNPHSDYCIIYLD